ncbi:glycosyltransferase family 39 protein [Roseateles sp.]|uniref:glycosyltransferase family 39 protein n=1 Tax=Roseateles sp. TaxID=1971397 RepID=UPI0025E56ED5|nr:glycosyltransferase family 39 protein [Roseateles sp.]MBV8037098.1 glycosyltransferase family 39 protein [Roseateles sp.]
MRLPAQLSRRLPSWWPLALLALWLVAFAGWRQVALPDEGRYGGVAYEMLSDGQWLTPTLFGLPYFHKPPLMYWIDIAAMHVLGPTPLALRAAPLLGAWLMGLALWIAARARYRDVDDARQALAWLAVLPLFYLGGQYANHDMLVAGWISLAIVSAQRALAPERRSLAWLCVAWAAMGLALLSKGLIGAVLPGLVVLPWLLWQRRWAALRFALHPLGLAVFAAVALPWLLAMQSRYPEFFDYFIVEQHFRRYTEARFNNAQPWWFFLAVLPLGTLPQSLRLPGALRRVGFELWWIVVILAFFSMPRSKLVGYVLPVLLPLSMLLFEAWRGRRGARWVWLASALLCVTIVPAVAHWGRPDHADIGAALRARLAPGDRVLLTGGAFFDLRLQARLDAPPAVLADWDARRDQGGDNWQRELLDAARFDPARGERVLWTPQRLAQERCAPGRLWLVATPADALPDAQPVFTGRRATLFELPRPANCP